MKSEFLKNLKNQTVHFIGIGGISMSSLAVMLKKMKVNVQGSNEVFNDEVARLKKKGIKVFLSHSKSNLQGVGVVVYSSAIPDDNEELVEAKNKNLMLVKRAELLGLIAGEFKTVVSVAGSHGKTTAASMIAEMLILAGKKPTVHLGGVLNSIKSNHYIGNKELFVTESCEYKDNFLYLKPDISVVLNVDADHLDYFGNLDGVKRSFAKFLNNTKDGGVNIVCADDENSVEFLKLENAATFGFGKKTGLRARSVKEYISGFYAFDVMFYGCKMGNIKLNIPGKHNVLNALACVMVGVLLGLDFEEIKTAIENFSGVSRRYEKIGEFNGGVVYHDYAHHHAQIKSVIQIARSMLRDSNGKLIVVFEPHTYSRTKYLIDEFAQSFIGADNLILAPVYSARELPSAGFDSLKLASEVKRFNMSVKCLDSYEEIKNELDCIIEKGDIVLILGAGSVERLARMF